MLHDILAIAWIISALVYAIDSKFRKESTQHIFQITNVSQRVIMGSLTAGMATSAVLHLAGYRIAIAGMPLMHWFFLFFLCWLWMRALVEFRNGNRGQSRSDLT